MSAASASYAGDIDVTAAWTLLETDARATLVDVRTRAEWTFVGLPDLAGLDKTPVLIEWQVWPAMDRRADFAADLAGELERRGVRHGDPVLFLCRSGARSQSAAIALTERGYSACYNVAGGFEGGLDAERHRGTLSGWKASGLPWVQS